MGRFLTANPFHMTLTGLTGLAIYRGLRSPKAWGPHALATFGLVVFAHGIYDAVLTIPVLVEYSIMGTIVFALVVYQFFTSSPWRSWRPWRFFLTLQSSWLDLGIWLTPRGRQA